MFPEKNLQSRVSACQNGITTLLTPIKGENNGRVRPRMLFTDAKAGYINYLRYEQGVTDRTIITYQTWLNRYARWLENEGLKHAEIDSALTKNMLRRYLYDLQRRGGEVGGNPLRPRTVRSAFNALRGLGKYLVDNKAMDEDHSREVILPKRDAAQRLLVSDKEVAELLKACERQSSERDIAFDLALLSGLVYTGVRAQELLDLRICDLNRHARKLTVAQGKGQKARTVVPSKPFWTAMEAWLAEREKMNCKHDWVWAQDTSRRISYDYLLRRINDIAARAGYKGASNIKPHSLRHWFATHALRQGANAKHIQIALGHANIETTYIYLHADEQDAEVMAELTDFDPDVVLAALKPTLPEAQTNTRNAPAPTVRPRRPAPRR